jgi:hypothetical protein
MIWKQYLWVVQSIFWIAVAFAAFGSFVNRKPARVCSGGRVEFVPNWFGKLGLLVIIARFAFIGAGNLRHAAGHPWTAFAGGLAEIAVLAFFFTLPGMIGLAIVTLSIGKVMTIRKCTAFVPPNRRLVRFPRF